MLSYAISSFSFLGLYFAPNYTTALICYIGIGMNFPFLINGPVYLYEMGNESYRSIAIMCIFLSCGIGGEMPFVVISYFLRNWRTLILFTAVV